MPMLLGLALKMLILYKKIYRLNAVTTNLSLASFTTKKEKELLCRTTKVIMIIIVKIIKSKMGASLSQTSIYIEKVY